MAPACLFSVALLALATLLAIVSGQVLLQDFCVADNMSTAFVDGFVCKDPLLATADDFYFSGLHRSRNTDNMLGFNGTAVSVVQIPGLNTLGVSFARLDYGPSGGLNAPHVHHRASEVLVVLKGKLQVGFITSNPGNIHIQKVLNKGDVFVFPQGLVHYQYNLGKSRAVALAALSSHNPGVITVANSVFGSQSAISSEVLTKAFQLDNVTVHQIKSRIAMTN